MKMCRVEITPLSCYGLLLFDGEGYYIGWHDGLEFINEFDFEIQPTHWMYLKDLEHE